MVLSAFMLSSSAPAPTPADSADDNPGNNLHVAPLSRDTQDADLDALFSRFGPLLKAQVMRDPHSRLVRGFGFVTFERPEDARERDVQGASVELVAVERVDRTARYRDYRDPDYPYRERA